MNRLSEIANNVAQIPLSSVPSTVRRLFEDISKMIDNPTLTPEEFYRKHIVKIVQFQTMMMKNGPFRVTIPNSRIQWLQNKYVAAWKKHKDQDDTEKRQVDQYLMELEFTDGDEETQREIKQNGLWPLKTPSRLPFGQFRPARNGVLPLTNTIELLAVSKNNSKGSPIGCKLPFGGSAEILRKARSKRHLPYQFRETSQEEADSKKKKENSSDLEDRQLQIPTFAPSERERTGLDKLVLALLSPFPNEHASTLNLCLAISMKLVPEPTHERDIILQFAKCPLLLDLLLAHSGVYNHSTLRELFQSHSKSNGIDYASFWSKLTEGTSSDIRKLQCESCYLSKRQDFRTTTSMLLPAVNIGVSSESKYACMCDEIAEVQDEYKHLSDLPAVSAAFELMTLQKQRFFTISCILKSTSFAFANAQLMANHLSVHRYILLALHSTTIDVAHNALSTLVNIAPCMKLTKIETDPTIKILLKFVLENGLFSSDRFVVTNCEDVLKGWFFQKDNHKILDEFVQLIVYERLHQMLLVRDIYTAICTFDCICTITQSNEKACYRFASLLGFVRNLISFLTTDENAIGKSALVGAAFLQVKTSVEASKALESSTTCIKSADNLGMSLHEKAVPTLENVMRPEGIRGGLCLGYMPLLSQPYQMYFPYVLQGSAGATSTMVFGNRVSILKSAAKCSADGEDSSRSHCAISGKSHGIFPLTNIREYQHWTFEQDKKKEWQSEHATTVPSFFRYMTALTLKYICKGSQLGKRIIAGYEDEITMLALDDSQAAQELHHILYELTAYELEERRAQYDLS